LTGTFIRVTTALAVLMVAGIAAIISYQHAYELVIAHGESGVTARLLPFTVDGLILAASMVILDASRRDQHVPPLAAWSLGCAIAATVGANLAHGLGHGPVGAVVSAWPALALVGSFELLMLLIRRSQRDAGGDSPRGVQDQPAPASPNREPLAPTLEQTVRDWHALGRSQRSISRELSIDRRKVRAMLDESS
jgi:hypothetical protein